MEIDIGAVVECVDGDAGKIAGLVVDRQSMKLIGLVVSRGRLAPVDIVVPMGVVRNVEPARAYLRLTVHELEEEYHKLYESEYVPLGNDWKIPSPDSPDELVLTTIPAVGSEPPLIPAESDLRHPFLLRELTNVPEGAVLLNKDTELVCPEGPVGTFERLLFDQTTNKATHIVMRLFSAPRLLVALPSYLVDRLEEGKIHLKAHKSFIESLPASPQVGS